MAALRTARGDRADTLIPAVPSSLATSYGSSPRCIGVRPIGFEHY